MNDHIHPVMQDALTGFLRIIPDSDRRDQSPAGKAYRECFAEAMRGEDGQGCLPPGVSWTFDQNFRVRRAVCHAFGTPGLSDAEFRRLVEHQLREEARGVTGRALQMRRILAERAAKQKACEHHWQSGYRDIDCSGDGTRTVREERCDKCGASR